MKKKNDRNVVEEAENALKYVKSMNFYRIILCVILIICLHLYVCFS